MTRLLFGLLIMSILGLACYAIALELAPDPDPEPERLTVQWVGKLVYAEKDKDGAFAGHKLTIDAKYEIGLRADGTVVWREKK